MKASKKSIGMNDYKEIGGLSYANSKTGQNKKEWTDGKRFDCHGRFRCAIDGLLYEAAKGENDMHKDSTTQAKQKKDEREEVLKEIRQLENRQKILENKQRNEERRVRTRRLIERGAVLEGIFPLAPNLSGAEVKAFLIALSHLPGAAELTANLPKSGDTP